MTEDGNRGTSVLTDELCDSNTMTAIAVDFYSRYAYMRRPQGFWRYLTLMGGSKELLLIIGYVDQ